VGDCGDLFRLLAERSRDLVYRYRLAPERGFEYVTPSATAITGYTPDEHYADPDLGFRLVHPEDRHLLERAAAGDLDEPLVIRWIRKDGSVVWTEQHNVAVFDDSGTLVAIEGSARNVTERVRAREALEASERRLRTLLERVPLLAGALDIDGRLVFANEALLALTGWTADEVVGRDWFTTFVPPAARSTLRRRFRRGARVGAFSSESTRELLLRNGGTRWVRWHIASLHDAAGQVVGLTAIGEDLTAEEERTAFETRLAAAVEQTADSVVITDPEANIVYVNPAFERATGYTLDEVHGRNSRILKSGRQSAAFYRRMWRTLSAGGSWSGELENRRRDGSLYLEEATITPVRDEHGAVSAYVGVKRDVTRLRELRDSLDAARRRRDEIARAIAGLEPGPTLEATAERITTALLAIPGAAAAGLLLFENGSAVRRVAMSTELDLPFALGELLPATRATYMRERAAQGPWVETWQVRQDEDGYGQAVAAAGITAVLNVPITNGDGPLGILSVSSAREDGVSALTGEIPSVVEVAAVARTLLGPALETRIAHQAAHARISAVIGERAFRPVFQPIIDLGTGEPVGFEALARFTDGVRPDLVFGEARHAGLGIELEAVTLGAALAAADELPAGPWLSLNVSPALIVEPGVLAGILGGRSRPVVLEITEHMRIDDYGALRSALVALGPDVRVAVDDAGAGVANFRHLVELRPDFVKLDMSLVRGVNADPIRQALVVGLLHFARVSSRLVIAEGIETEAERRTLQALGVGLGQGYLLGRPAEAAAWAGAAVSDPDPDAQQAQ